MTTDNKEEEIALESDKTASRDSNLDNDSNPKKKVSLATILSFCVFAIIFIGLSVYFNLDNDSDKKDIQKKEVRAVNKKVDLTANIPFTTNEIPPVNIPPIKIYTNEKPPIRKSRFGSSNIKSIIAGSALSAESEQNKNSLSGNSKKNSNFSEDKEESIEDIVNRRKRELGVNDNNTIGRNNLGNNDVSLLGQNKVFADKFEDRNYLLAKGNYIDCVLDTKIITSIRSLITCHTIKDIYSDNGVTLLIERGSKVVGEFSDRAKIGNNRIFALWSRIITPNGVSINIGSPVIDTLGAGGILGKLDNKYFERIGASFLLSVGADLIAYGLNSQKSSGDITYSQTNDNVNEVVGEIIKDSLKIEPVIYKTQGEKIGIMVARDIDFSKVYKLDYVANSHN